jgi:3-hydroxybutyryl-CoA dehydratase
MKYKIGDKVEENFSFSQEDVNLFMNLTGDKNPVHYDEEYTKDTIFKKPIIHGFLASSIFSKILGMEMPGKGTIYINQNISFKRPMYVDEVYTCIVEILEINENRFTLSTKVEDKDHQVVIDGNAYVMNNDL